MNNKKLHRIRFFLTVGLLIAFGSFLILLTDTIGLDESDGLPFLVLLISSFFLSFAMNIIWRYSLVPINELEQKTKSVEKQKRERIDSVLRDLSNEDLLRLKQRLVDGSIDDNLLEAQLIGDDGELLVMEKNS